MKITRCAFLFTASILVLVLFSVILAVVSAGVMAAGSCSGDPTYVCPGIKACCNGNDNKACADITNAAICTNCGCTWEGSTTSTTAQPANTCDSSGKCNQAPSGYAWNSVKSCTQQPVTTQYWCDGSTSSYQHSGGQTSDCSSPNTYCACSYKKTCTNGCSNGKCTCTADTDCGDAGCATCSGGQCSYASDGTTCSGGTCDGAGNCGGSGGSSCTETDGGKNYYIPGKVTYTDTDGNTKTYKDSCAAGNVLTEYYCNNDKEASTTITCGIFCNQPSESAAGYCTQCLDTSDPTNDVKIRGNFAFEVLANGGKNGEVGNKYTMQDWCAADTSILSASGEPDVPVAVINTMLVNDHNKNGVYPSGYTPMPGDVLLQVHCGDDKTPYLTAYKCPVADNVAYGCYAGTCLAESDLVPASDDACTNWKSKRCEPASITSWQRCEHEDANGHQCESCIIDCSPYDFSCIYHTGGGEKVIYNLPEQWNTNWLAEHCNEKGSACVPAKKLSWDEGDACYLINPSCFDNPSDGYSIKEVGQLEGSPCRTCDFNEESCSLCKGSWLEPLNTTTNKVIKGGCCDSNFYDDIDETGGVWREYPDCGKSAGNKICDAADYSNDKANYKDYVECWQGQWADSACYPFAPAAKLNKGGTWNDGSSNPIRKLGCDNMTYVYNNTRWFKAEGNCTEVNDSTKHKMYLDYTNSSWAVCDSTKYYTAINCTISGTPTEHFCTEDGWKTDVALRCTPDKSQCDYCSRSDMCMLNPESTTNSLPDPRCVNLSVYDNDNYCFNGTWSTRTALVAEQLLNFAQGKDYTLFCDQPEKALNDYSELLFPGDAGAWLTGVNKFCTLEYKDGSTVRRAVATSLNKDYYLDTEVYGFLQSVLKLPADFCKSAISKDDKFYQCNDNRVWWDNKTQIVIYSAEGIELQPNIITNFMQKFNELLFDPVRFLINLIKASFADQPLQLNKYFKDVTDFDRYYEAKVGTRSVKGFIRNENDCTAANICGKYVSVSFGNVSEDICAYVNKWDLYSGIATGNPTMPEVHCTQSGDNYYVVSHADEGGEFAAVEKIWTDLTAKLRVK